MICEVRSQDGRLLALAPTKRARRLAKLLDGSVVQTSKSSDDMTKAMRRIWKADSAAWRATQADLRGGKRMKPPDDRRNMKQDARIREEMAAVLARLESADGGLTPAELWPEVRKRHLRLTQLKRGFVKQSFGIEVEYDERGKIVRLRAA